jgi:hypothetical protein
MAAQINKTIPTVNIPNIPLMSDGCVCVTSKISL